MRNPFKKSVKGKDASKSERRRVLNQERVKEEALMVLDALMKKEGITKRTDLAEHLGHSRSYITKLLGGDHNFTLEKLADLTLSLGEHAIHFYVTRNPERMTETIVQDDGPLPFLRPRVGHTSASAANQLVVSKQRVMVGMT
jgi:plasmid maintenance system antidote protein VapI